MTEKNINVGKTTDGLLLKLLQNEFRPRLKKMVNSLRDNDHTSSPLAALVDLTSRCNLGCSWCIDKYVLSNNEIPINIMMKLLKDFKEMEIKSIVYFGGGEPLMYSGINEVLEKTYEYGIDYAINTNGIFLGKALKNIASTCSWIRISLDAGSEEKYKELHDGKTFFKEIVSNVNLLNQIKKGTVGTSFVVMDNNIDDIDTSAKLMKSIGCDFIQFKPMYIPNDKNERSLDKYRKEQNKKIEDALNRAKCLEDKSFAVLVTGSMKTLLNNQPINQSKTYSYCAAQQFIPLITPSGVYTCPNLRGSKKGWIGDINKNSFSDIWKSQTRKCVIKNLNPSQDCSLSCLRHQINVVVNSLLECEKMGVHLLDFIDEIKGEEISDRYFI